MTLLKNTISLCPLCLADIPASIYEVEGMAVMRKTCPEHGLFNSIVERDAAFYMMVQRNAAPMFYEGLIIDITYRCNIRCKWCFQHLSNEDVPVERIFKLASQMPRGHKIILSGGEPTLREDFPAIVHGLNEMGYDVNVITNGYKLDWALPCKWTLSHHPESEGLFNEKVAEAQAHDHTFASIIYTDNDLQDYYKHVLEAMNIKDICTVFRMHIAAPVGGNLTDECNGFFVSDMYKMLLEKKHEVVLYPPKTIFAPITVDCVPFMLISWNTAANVDILENHCEPWYHGRGNVADNLVTRIIRDN